MAEPELEQSAVPARRLKVAVLNRNFTPTAGGAECYSIALVEELAVNHDIHVFAQCIEHDWPGVHYHRIAKGLRKPRWLNQLWYAYACWRAVRIGFDIVHSHENVWFGNVHTMHVKTVQRSLMGNRSGVRVLLRKLKIALSPRLLTYLGLERARLRGQPDRAIVAASPVLAEELKQEYPRVIPFLSVVTPGVRVPDAKYLNTSIAGKSATKKEARQAISTDQDGKIILFVANDYVRKGLPALLLAVQQLPADTRLLVVGNVDQIPQFLGQAKKLGISQRVEFLGPMRDVRMAYMAADVLAHPTLEDSFGMVVVEAMAHALPVVVSCAAYCGVSALIEHKNQALIVNNPRDAGDLAVAISRVLEGTDLRDGLIERALSFAKLHDWKKVAASYNAIYQALAPHHPNFRRSA